MSKDPSLKILRIPAVIAKRQLSRGTLYRLLKQKEFPAPIHLGDRAIGFIESEVDEWLSRKMQQREAGHDALV